MKGERNGVKKIFWILFVLCAALGGFTTVQYLSRDKVPPVISFSEADALTYEEGMTDEELLRGIIAYDDVDGDVSDSLKVEFVAADPEAGTVTVTYAARDKSNNVAKASQILKYQSESETRKKSGN